MADLPKKIQGLPNQATRVANAVKKIADPAERAIKHLKEEVKIAGLVNEAITSGAELGEGLVKYIDPAMDAAGAAIKATNTGDKKLSTLSKTAEGHILTKEEALAKQMRTYDPVMLSANPKQEILDKIAKVKKAPKTPTITTTISKATNPGDVEKTAGGAGEMVFKVLDTALVDAPRLMKNTTSTAVSRPTTGLTKNIGNLNSMNKNAKFDLNAAKTTLKNLAKKTVGLKNIIKDYKDLAVAKEKYGLDDAKVKELYSLVKKEHLKGAILPAAALGTAGVASGAYAVGHKKEAGIKEYGEKALTIGKELVNATKNLKNIPKHVKAVGSLNARSGAKGMDALSNYAILGKMHGKGLILPVASAGTVAGAAAVIGHEKKAGVEKVVEVGKDLLENTKNLREHASGLLEKSKELYNQRKAVKGLEKSVPDTIAANAARHLYDSNKGNMLDSIKEHGKAVAKGAVIPMAGIGATAIAGKAMFGHKKEAGSKLESAMNFVKENPVETALVGGGLAVSGVLNTLAIRKYRDAKRLLSPVMDTNYQEKVAADKLHAIKGLAENGEKMLGAIKEKMKFHTDLLAENLNKVNTARNPEGVQALHSAHANIMSGLQVKHDELSARVEKAKKQVSGINSGLGDVNKMDHNLATGENRSNAFDVIDPAKKSPAPVSKEKIENYRNLKKQKNLVPDKPGSFSLPSTKKEYQAAKIKADAAGDQLQAGNAELKQRIKDNKLSGPNKGFGDLTSARENITDAKGTNLGLGSDKPQRGNTINSNANTPAVQKMNSMKNTLQNKLKENPGVLGVAAGATIAGGALAIAKNKGNNQQYQPAY